MSKSHKTKHRYGQRRCIFCGKSENISKEHVFPLWLREFFPRDTRTTHKSVSYTWRDETGPHTPKEERQRRQGHVGSKQVRVVCIDCNAGWLSQLEQRASRDLPPLITAQRCNLLEGGQALLATWAAKTAMVTAYLKPMDSGITQEERTWLMNKLTPPPRWYVWISAYNGAEWKNLSISQVRGALNPTPVARPSDALYYAQATTFGLGHILFCVLSSSSPSVEARFTGREISGFVQIWPPLRRSILWPPFRIFGDKEAHAVANILRLSGILDNSLDPGADWTFTF